ncbi:MAG: IS200/IS605 family accessory protein TnpB-related protein [Thermoplasmata archaeon]
MGIKNIAVLSNNIFFNSRHLREVKGIYQYLKRRLQHLGTHYSKRKLRNISRWERRFLRDFNYIISRRIVSFPYDVISLEAVNPAQMKQNGQGKKFRKMLGSWSPCELEKYVEYKAEDAGKIVVYVNPNKYNRNAQGSNTQRKIIGTVRYSDAEILVLNLMQI